MAGIKTLLDAVSVNKKPIELERNGKDLADHPLNLLVTVAPNFSLSVGSYVLLNVSAGQRLQIPRDADRYFGISLRTRM